MERARRNLQRVSWIDADFAMRPLNEPGEGNDELSAAPFHEGKRLGVLVSFAWSPMVIF
jgi:hypothetical protein